MSRSDPQQRITACWNMASRGYDATPGHGLMTEAERSAWHRVLRDVLPDTPSDVLDVGTGTGFLAFRAHEFGHRVRGIDLSEEMLSVARNATSGMRGAPKFTIGDALAPDFPPASFDVVMNRHLLWTLTDPELALRNWRELLRPHGRIVLIDGIWHDEDEDNEREEQAHLGTTSTLPKCSRPCP